MLAELIPTDLPGLLIIESKLISDSRGYFEETWNRKWLLRHGIEAEFVQDNHSHSREAGTVRGFHLQNPPNAQTKLVRCSRGAIFDVSVDVRVGSPTFRRSFGIELSAENRKQVLIPPGFLHAFVTLVDNSEVQYKCSEYYEPLSEVSVLWNSIDIEWPISRQPIISKKDSEAQPFAAYVSQFKFGDIE